MAKYLFAMNQHAQYANALCSQQQRGGVNPSSFLGGLPVSHSSSGPSTLHQMQQQQQQVSPTPSLYQYDTHTNSLASVTTPAGTTTTDPNLHLFQEVHSTSEENTTQQHSYAADAFSAFHFNEDEDDSVSLMLQEHPFLSVSGGTSTGAQTLTAPPSQISFLQQQQLLQQQYLQQQQFLQHFSNNATLLGSSSLTEHLSGSALPEGVLGNVPESSSSPPVADTCSEESSSSRPKYVGGLRRGEWPRDLSSEPKPEQRVTSAKRIAITSQKTPQLRVKRVKLRSFTSNAMLNIRKCNQLLDVRQDKLFRMDIHLSRASKKGGKISSKQQVQCLEWDKNQHVPSTKDTCFLEFVGVRFRKEDAKASVPWKRSIAAAQIHVRSVKTIKSTVQLSFKLPRTQQEYCFKTITNKLEFVFRIHFLPEGLRPQDCLDARTEQLGTHCTEIGLNFVCSTKKQGCILSKKKEITSSNCPRILSLRHDVSHREIDFSNGEGERDGLVVSLARVRGGEVCVDVTEDSCATLSENSSTSKTLKKAKQVVSSATTPSNAFSSATKKRKRKEEPYLLPPVHEEKEPPVTRGSKRRRAS
uniref:Uncharacterized protein n=1 Tax=Percolomonas cosmopolitus TaxID=63605 RepID=A0A7S1KMZ0_9EUKA